MKIFITQLLLVYLVLVETRSFVFKVDPTIKGTLQIVDSTIEQKIFDSYFFDVLYSTKSQNNQFSVTRHYYKDNKIYTRTASSLINYKLMTVSKYPKNCAMFFDQNNSKVVFYQMENQLMNLNGPFTLSNHPLISFQIQEIQISSDCYCFRKSNDIYYTYQSLWWGDWKKYSLEAQTASSNDLASNYHLKMDKYGFSAVQYFTGFQQIFYMNLLSKNQLQCSDSRCVTISYESVEPISFKFIVLQKNNSQWKIKFQYNAQSVITPIINVNHNFKNILLTFQTKQTRPLSVINIQCCGTDQNDIIIFLPQQMNGKSRESILSENYLLYVNKTLDEKGKMRFTVYQKENSKKVFDQSVNSKSMSKYIFSVIQETSDKGFNRLLNIFQNESIFYWCQEFDYNSCVKDNNSISEVFLQTLINSSSTSKSDYTISDPLWIIIISVPTFIILLLIILIILGRNYYIACPDFCWVGLCGKILQFVGIDEDYVPQNVDQSNESLEENMEKQQNEDKLQEQPQFWKVKSQQKLKQSDNLGE